jgi:hypothetical protein
MFGLICKIKKVGPLRGYIVTWREGSRLGTSSLPLVTSGGYDPKVGHIL